jgi:preprotein translocase subunit SecG
MSLLIGFLTFILVLTSLFLILLVLVQLPKKEAGIGVAFGGGATDALFGAGTGNALTKMTKYSSAVFLGLSLVLAVLNTQRHQSASKTLEQELSRKSTAAPMITPPPKSTAPAAANQGALTLGTNQHALKPNTGSLSNAGPLQLQPVPARNPPAAPKAGTNK